MCTGLLMQHFLEVHGWAHNISAQTQLWQRNGLRTSLSVFTKSKMATIPMTYTAHDRLACGRPQDNLTMQVWTFCRQALVSYRPHVELSQPAHVELLGGGGKLNMAKKWKILKKIWKWSCLSFIMLSWPPVRNSTCTRVHTHTHTHTHTHIYIYIHTHAHCNHHQAACVCIYIYMCVCVCVCVCVYTCTCWVTDGGSTQHDEN